MAIITLIVMFIIIHLFFCYQLGLPASVVQDNSTDLTLSASDWLGFLGGYLGFSGSLIMAYLVYRQNKTINNLTLSEYVPSVNIRFMTEMVHRLLNIFLLVTIVLDIIPPYDIVSTTFF